MEGMIEVVERLINDLFIIKDRYMRTYTLAKKLKDMSAEEIAEIFYLIHKRASQKLPKYQEIFLSMVDIPRISGIFGLSKMSEIYTLLRKKGYNELAELLTRHKAPKRRLDSANPPENIKIEYLTLGERRALAKSKNKDTLDRLLFDPDPGVIKNILNNPRITEREVIKIASMRPISQDILRVIFENKKWISRYGVKKALIRNPYTPLEISLALLNFMLFQDLKELLEDRSLHPEIHRVAKNILKKANPSLPDQSLS